MGLASGFSLGKDSARAPRELSSIAGAHSQPCGMPLIGLHLPAPGSVVSRESGGSYRGATPGSFKPVDIECCSAHQATSSKPAVALVTSSNSSLRRSQKHVMRLREIWGRASDQLTPCQGSTREQYSVKQRSLESQGAHRFVCALSPHRGDDVAKLPLHANRPRHPSCTQKLGGEV